MKKVLVTGATGFIGNYVVNSLLENNYHVIATSSSLDNAKKQSWFNRVPYLPFNLESFDDSVNYFHLFQEPDILIHLAWEGLPNYKSSFHYEINLPRHTAFLQNLIRNGLTDISVTGTCFEYGMKEGCLKEDMTAEPANAYALAKDNLRKALEDFQLVFRFHLKWIRLFYMYGKGQSANSLVSQLDKALEQEQQAFNMSGGEQVRDYLPVEVVAENIIKISVQQKVTGIINCCSGKPVTVKEFVENYLQNKHKNIRLNLGYYPYADYEPMRFWGDNTKLKSITDAGQFL
jgi:dTDP-6-deoxy-L-talose 4-dehydrogenase (NAD+)